MFWSSNKKPDPDAFVDRDRYYVTMRVSQLDLYQSYFNKMLAAIKKHRYKVTVLEGLNRKFCAQKGSTNSSRLRFRHVSAKRANTSEPLITCRKGRDVIKTSAVV